MPCGNCGRTFLPDRLKVHARSCKPGAKRKVFTVNPVEGGLQQINPKQKQILSKLKATECRFGLEETKLDENACRYCNSYILPGKLFDHESTCPSRAHGASSVKNASAMGAITHPAKRHQSMKSNWRLKHQEFITAVKLGKQIAAL